MKLASTLVVAFLSFGSIGISQETTSTSPCSQNEILNRHLHDNPEFLLEQEKNETFTKQFVEELVSNRENRAHDSTATYIIPVVLHIFHYGDDGFMDAEQAQSGIDILNRDFPGLNDDWETIIPEFDAVKGSLDIQFCLASIDPDGNPTTGINYYEDSLKMLNSGDLFSHAWDNFKYLNIYLPKYTGGEPSLFTAYAYYPDLLRVENNIDGIFYSSIRWGYGTHSELEDGQEWASVCTHETGHWLNLRHTFEGGCDFGDYVDDTPPTLGGTIELEGCYNNDYSCAVATNGSNYMDYNHDCKKMFTQGQVDRMTAALYLEARINMWSTENLIATGCMAAPAEISEFDNLEVNVYPNPTSSLVNFEFDGIPSEIIIYNVQGEILLQRDLDEEVFTVDASAFGRGVYFYKCVVDGEMVNGKIAVE